MPTLFRLAVSIVAMVVTAFLAAIGFGIYDIYRTGHGLDSIMAVIIEHPGVGVHLNLADIAVLLLAAIGGTVTWILTGRTRRTP